MIGKAALTKETAMVRSCMEPKYWSLTNLSPIFFYGENYDFWFAKLNTIFLSHEL